MLTVFIRDLPFLLLEPKKFFESFKEKKVVDLLSYVFLLFTLSTILYICGNIISSAMTDTPIVSFNFLFVAVGMFGASVGLFLGIFAFHYKAIKWHGNNTEVQLSVPIGIYSMTPFVVLLFLMNFSWWFLLLGAVYSVYFYHLGLKRMGTHGMLNWITAVWGVFRGVVAMSVFALGAVMVLSSLLKI